METLDTAPSTPTITTNSEHQTPSPLPPSVLRLWRPQAHRNLRNNWSQLADFGNVGDGGGFPVFTFYSITSHEKFAEDLVQIDYLSIGYDTSEVKQLHWSTQLYDDEFKDLTYYNLYCEVTHGPVPPSFTAGKSDVISLRFDNQPNPEILQLAEANIDTLKVNEIFIVDGKEMHVSIV
ncbi:hypothetical protein V8G54_006138 [Vigna mungo]|uniref:Uncharacterized protein n=1 Tax=Vigna mungo TaxID=3915 RepID=A0AAQ3P104_VIGMU